MLLLRGAHPLPLGEGWGEGTMPTNYRGGAIKSTLLDRSRRLRRESTDAERAIWRLLRNRQFVGTKFRRQHEYGRYILDFFCPEQKLAIEVDGEQHLTPVGARRDAARSRHLAAQGVRVRRFTNIEVLRETDTVL